MNRFGATHYYLGPHQRIIFPHNHAYSQHTLSSDLQVSVVLKKKVGDKPFTQHLFHLLITAKVVSSYNISEWTKHVIIWSSQVRTVGRNLQHLIYQVLVEVNSGWVLYATMQHPVNTPQHFAW